VTQKIESLREIVEENSNKIATYEEQITSIDEQLKSIQKKNKVISSEREMKALSMEEELAKEKLAFANEEIERLGKVNDAKNADAKELEDALVELTDSVNEVKKVSEKEISDIEKQKEGLYKKRVENVSAIDQKILVFYEKVRKWAGNTAVVAVKKQACYGCYMKINDKTYSEVIKGEEIVGCPHCGRILYLETDTSEA